MIVVVFLISLLQAYFFEKLQVSELCTNDICYPRIVWSFWDDNLPEDVEEMVKVSKTTLKDFTFCFLTQTNVSSFLDVNAFPKDYHILARAVKADYIRVCLLARYGGIWVDATTYIRSEDEMQSFLSEAVKVKASLFSFQSTTPTYMFSSFFFGSSSNSFVVKKYKEEFDFALAEDARNYSKSVCSLLFPKVILLEDTCKRGGGMYFLMEHVFSLMVYKNETLKDEVLLLPTSDRRCPVRLLMHCRWRKKCVRDHLLNNPAVRAHPFIKLNQSVRDGKKIGFAIFNYDPKLEGQMFGSEAKNGNKSESRGSEAKNGNKSESRKKRKRHSKSTDL